MLAVIPYTTFPEIGLGPLQLRTFGLMVGLGVLVGAWLGARYAEHYGVSRDETYRLATWMVFAGVLGARLTWDVTHWSEIDNPIDLIAVWEGGLQFSGGFIAAILVGLPSFRAWTRLGRWHRLDGYAYGLTMGMALGRVGCYAVGEHFGSASSWLLAVRYDGGDTREPARLGATFHNTSLYEILWLVALFVALTIVMHRKAKPATLAGLFCLVYGICRFLSDFLRAYDDTVLGLTGAQWMSLLLVPAGLWMLYSVRPSLAAETAASAAELGVFSDEDDAGEPGSSVPDELEAPDTDRAAFAAADGADQDSGADDDNDEGADTFDDPDRAARTATGSQETGTVGQAEPGDEAHSDDADNSPRSKRPQP